MERTLIKQTPEFIEKKIRVNGWVHRIRFLGQQLVFIDLRDRSGILQVVCYKPDLSQATIELLNSIRPEFVLQIEGEIKLRDEKQINPEIETGKVELAAKEIVILNHSQTPPFELDKDTSGINEELRLKYRYLDLRSKRMQSNIRLRDKIISFFREYMHKNDFVEIETPILMKGTPEGSREYIVPSRLHSGKFYVLPQSPQQFKQLLMVSGFERYFQIARCFRDEDQRGDRQPEFTQLDFEMSFVTQEDVLQYTEAMFVEMVEKLLPEKFITTIPFPRLTYAQSIEEYGSDKPDLRNDKNNPNELAFAWVLDFPMFEKDENGNIAAKHHPFCSIKEEDKEKFMRGEDLMNIRANAYDLVLNGYELSSGSIRIHEQELQKRIFDLLQISEQEQKDRFGHMLEAFTFGAPPHGGFAPGIDRIVMLMAGEPNIREVIAFPKTGDARDLLMGAPNEVSSSVLSDVHIKTVES
ncbi:aspartate--tRNA ligase [Candidatus Uhrbacteria bacterium CG_4_9_14_3_um_filter_36_7]|uniref:Aspartate--tRNA ligase n=1 Tax=Candidatus Uhrbacteria bacterium CG_4_9_14_3_um_filter_36_7 TaxID=1975033 RepID=A0A2M7XIH7_9BACT|nr:MAG: aspartate--tRNA ligase [Candidatus Uhrbacteria bacterium CG_4_9_14_3_um_filter_36_7]